MKKRFLALALGTLAFGVTLGGVKMGLGHQDALMVKAADASTSVVFTSATDKTNSKDTKTITKDGVTLTSSSGLLNDAGGFRFYSGSNLTIKCDVQGTVITSIEFFCGDTSGKNDVASNLTTETGEYVAKSNKGTWSGSAESVVFKLKSQVRATQISITTQPTTPVVTSPVTAILAERADPNATFYAGDSIGLADFVITATHKDGNTSVLKSDVTIENPVLVEGENVIKFHYVSGETSFECQLVVNAIQGNFFTKSTDTADIVAGKKIYIANADGTKILDKQNDNNRAEIEVKVRENKIVAKDSYTSLLVLPAKNGTFALYDEKGKGVLYAASSSKNYLRTETAFEDIDANSFASISYSKDAWSIQFTGSNSNKNLRYNSSSKLFSCYGSGQVAPSIYVSPDAPMTFGTETWAETFLAKLNEICDPTGNTALTEAKWSEAKATFDALSIPDKMAIKYGNFEGKKMKQALVGYDFIINTKYATYYDFLGRRATTKANALMLPGAADSTTWSLVGIGTVTIAASASLLFFRRKKSN